MKLTKSGHNLLNTQFSSGEKSFTNKNLKSANLLHKIASVVSSVEEKYSKDKKKSAKFNKIFFEMLSNGYFLPNNNILESFCQNKPLFFDFLALESIDGLKNTFENLKNVVVLQENGITTSLDIRNIGLTDLEEVLKIYNASLNLVKNTDTKCGICLPVEGVQILPFVEISSGETINKLNPFVIISKNFLEAAKSGKKFSFIDFQNKKKIEKIDADKIFDKICHIIWEFGPPAIIFSDNITGFAKGDKNLCLSPDGSQITEPFEFCPTGAINMNMFVDKNTINFEKLKEIIHDSVRFLDNLIDCTQTNALEPLKIHNQHRKIGLGVMGFADMLIKLGIPYNSPKAIQIAEKLMKFINEEAHKASINLSFEKSPLLDNKNATALKKKQKTARNISITSITQTGSSSALLGVSSGITPIFAVAYIRKDQKGKEIFEWNKNLENILKKEKLFDQDLLKEILNEGTILSSQKVPESIKTLFLSAREISYEWQIKVAAACQKFTDAGVSTTITLPQSATKEDIKNAIFLSQKLKCKSVSFFRIGCKREKILPIAPEDTGRIAVTSGFSGGNPLI